MAVRWSVWVIDDDEAPASEGTLLFDGLKDEEAVNTAVRRYCEEHAEAFDDNAALAFLHDGSWHLSSSTLVCSTRLVN